MLLSSRRRGGFVDLVLHTRPVTFLRSAQALTSHPVLGIEMVCKAGARLDRNLKNFAITDGTENKFHTCVRSCLQTVQIFSAPNIA